MTTTEQRTTNQEIFAVPQASQPAVLAALDWYEQVKLPSGAAPKKDVTPRAIKDFISNLWMIERLDDGRFKVRLFSGEAARLAGKDYTGHIIDPAGPFAKWLPFYTRVLSSRRPSVVHNRITERNQWYLTSECALLPISETEGTTTLVLVAYALLKTDA